MNKSAKTCKYATELADSFNNKVSTYCRKKQMNIEHVFHGEIRASDLHKCESCEFWEQKIKKEK